MVRSRLCIESDPTVSLCQEAPASLVDSRETGQQAAKLDWNSQWRESSLHADEVAPGIRSIADIATQQGRWANSNRLTRTGGVFLARHDQSVVRDLPGKKAAGEENIMTTEFA